MRIGRRATLGVGAVVGTIVLGAIGSGVWEMLAKPGVSRLGRVFLALLTLGSQRARDAAYSSAALDPTPLPSLVLLYLAVPIPLFLLWTLIAARLVERIVRPVKQRADKFLQMPDSDEAAKQAKIDAGKALLARVRRWRNVLLLASAAMLLGVYVIGYIAYAILNQSVLIWRVFHANYRICAPYMSPQQQAELQSRFAAMTSRQDFQPIDAELVRIATEHKLHLIRARLW